MVLSPGLSIFPDAGMGYPSLSIFPDAGMVYPSLSILPDAGMGYRPIFQVLNQAPYYLLLGHYFD